MLRLKLAVSFAPTADGAHKEAEKFLNCKIENASRCEAFAIAELRRSFVWVSPKAARARIFHECFHLTLRILKEIRAEGTDEEINAHLNEFITERVLSLWEKERLGWQERQTKRRRKP